MNLTLPRPNLSQHILALMERHADGIGPRRLAQSLNAPVEHIRDRLRTLAELGLVTVRETIGEWDVVRYSVVGIG